MGIIIILTTQILELRAEPGTSKVLSYHELSLVFECIKDSNIQTLAATIREECLYYILGKEEITTTQSTE